MKCERTNYGIPDYGDDDAPEAKCEAEATHTVTVVNWYEMKLCPFHAVKEVANGLLNASVHVDLLEA